MHILAAPPPLSVCAKPLGMESGKIPDAAITASSSHNAAHGPRNGRLNFKAGRGRTGAWSALHNDRGQFLQVDLGKVSKVTRMATQGRQDHDQWVTSYTLSYSVHGGHYHEYNNGQVIILLFYNQETSCFQWNELLGKKLRHPSQPLEQETWIWNHNPSEKATSLELGA